VSKRSCAKLLDMISKLALLCLIAVGAQAGILRRDGDAAGNAAFEAAMGKRDDGDASDKKGFGKMFG
jgi:hypothetical protein